MGKGPNLHIPCGKCKSELNTWDVRFSKALGYRNILVCEECMKYSQLMTEVENDG